MNHGGEEIDGYLVENEYVTQEQEDATKDPVEQLLEANVPLPLDLINDTAHEVTVEAQSNRRYPSRNHGPPERY